jgi:hypothetical protein
LVQNFENLNPANTLWTKQYNLYSKIDTEAPRYLEFERWWGAHTRLNAEEMQFIVDELFVGNHLAAGDIKFADGVAVDLRAIRTPIVVFCSKGDNITPPQQALGWVLDAYDSVEEIQSYGQTIVYTIHEKIGHLGIFVSAGVARKEHGEFSSNIDLIDTLPPGLYEAIFEEKTDKTAHAELVTNQWVMRCEMRTLDDIRALGGNSEEDDRRFATAARVSDINLALYRTYLQPLVRELANPYWAEWLRRAHPLALPYEIFSDANPLLCSVAQFADQIREHRHQLALDNVFLRLQDELSKQIVFALDTWGRMRDCMSEAIFLNLYGSPALQAAVGIDPRRNGPFRKAGKDALHSRFVLDRVAELRSKMNSGGLREALIRAAIYIGMPRGNVDERGFETIRRVRLAAREERALSLSKFKATVREQFFMLLIDADAAVSAIQSLLPSDETERRRGFELLKHVLEARGEVEGEAARRLERVERMFGLDIQPSRALPDIGRSEAVR